MMLSEPGELEGCKDAIIAFIIVAAFGTFIYFCMFVMPDIIIGVAPK